MPSKHYSRLILRLGQLRKHLLPATFSATNVYTPQELDGARAYRVLAHAEIEHYVEIRVLEIAEAAFDRWKATTQPSKTLACFLTNVTGEQHGLPRKMGTTTTPITIAGKVLSQFRHSVLQNNGIRTENILRLLLPIGVAESEIDPVWIAVIDGFGASRGVAAHAASIKYSINPKDDHDSVSFVLTGLLDVDERLSKLKRSIR